MATASSLTLTQKLYVAYYGRPADPFGLEAWATMIDKNGGAVSVDIVNQFGSSAEANSLFGGKTTAQKVNAIYLQCFGREAETDGLRAWVQAIDSGRVTQAGAMLEILNGASGSDATAVANKLSIASAFTSALDTTPEITAYAGDTAASQARSFLGAVTADASTLNAASNTLNTVITSLSQLDALGFIIRDLGRRHQRFNVQCAAQTGADPGTGTASRQWFYPGTGTGTGLVADV